METETVTIKIATETTTEPTHPTESETGVPTDPPTDAATEPLTDVPTEPETDPVREALELSVEVNPYIPDAPAGLQDIKAMWLSQFDLNKVYTNGGSQRTEEAYRERIGDILTNVADNGFNTVIVQVRPNADSFYPSEFYAPSMYVTGSYRNGFDYDPFSIFIEEARKLGLSVHAWINPLRGVTTDELQQMDGIYPLRQWYDNTELRGRYIVEYGGRWYLNPAYAEVRDLIVYGAREILQKYAVEGIHMDDYFYPTQDTSFDADAYRDYLDGGGSLKLDDWRRENLSDLVSRLYRMVKQHDSGTLFGISPAGIIKTVYEKQYADVYRWCKEPGFLDYILPQIYFGFEHATAAFDKLCDQWQGMIQTEYVDLLIGVTFGKALAKYDKWAGSGADEWAQHTDIMARCISYTFGLEKCRGMSVFCYQYFYDPVTGVPVAETQTERDGYIKILKQASWEE